MQRIRNSKNPLIQSALSELEKYRARVAQINRLKDKREELQINYTAVKSIDYSKLRVQGGVPTNYLVETAVKWAELDAELDRLVVENEHELMLIEYKLSLLNTNEQTVLFKYFIEGRTIVEIALLLNYSEQGIRKIKTQALKKYAQLFLGEEKNENKT
ncbi:MAG: sigma factor-like helix-turn-helix DNA-binding protein [Christensenellales bacterium]